MSKVAVVTGANQGLGLALVEGLARGLEAEDVVYLTGRDPERVAAAAERIADARAQVLARTVDVRDAAAVEAFASDLYTAHGGLDIVFSNHYARVMPSDSPPEVVAGFVDANNLGTTRLLRAFAPILRDGGRLLVVASTYGSLIALAPQLHARFDTTRMTLDDLDSTMLRWRDEVIDGRARDQGWPEFINIPSKVGQVAAVRILARDRRALDADNGTFVAAVCPGMIDTGASRPWFDMSDAQTPPQAARALLRLALDPNPGPSFYGELIRFGKILPWR
jgi:carbonyl reductase 1